MKFLDYNPTDDSTKMVIPNSSFTFSGVRFDKLGALEYTLVSLAMDISGSVAPYEAEFLKVLNTVVDACKKSPRKENILFRFITFNHGLTEVHGFIPLVNIQQYDAKDLKCSGTTALFDATYSSVGASKAYAKSLIDAGYSVNNIMYIITDGEDNASSTTPAKIKKEIEETLHSELFGTVTTILIGVNSVQCGAYLSDFQKEANLTQYIDMGDITPGKLAKLAGMISKSVSSASQSLNSGTPVAVQTVTF